MKETQTQGFLPLRNSVRADDATLIRSAIQGDSDAYQELCQRHSKQVFRTVMRILHNTEDAEDVLQESLLKAFVNLSFFKQTSAFSTWLTRIGINCALMLLRRRRSGINDLLSFPSELGDNFFIEVATDAPSPEDLLLAAERGHILFHAISKLPPALREVLSCRLQHEASVAEIAVAVSLSEPAVKARLHRARSRLRQTMGNRS